MAKTEEQVPVKFLKSWKAYHTGEVATFLPSTAAKLVEVKIAEPVDAAGKQAVAQVTKVVTKG